MPQLSYRVYDLSETLPLPLILILILIVKINSEFHFPFVFYLTLALAFAFACSILPSTIESLAPRISNSLIELGTRMVVVYPDDDSQDNSDDFAKDEEAVRELKLKFLDWLDGRSDRAGSFH